MTLLTDLRNQLEEIAEELTDLSSDYELDDDIRLIMEAVDAIQEANECLDIVGASQ